MHALKGRNANVLLSDVFVWLPAFVDLNKPHGKEPMMSFQTISPAALKQNELTDGEVIVSCVGLLVFEGNVFIHWRVGRNFSRERLTGTQEHGKRGWGRAKDKLANRKSLSFRWVSEKVKGGECLCVYLPCRVWVKFAVFSRCVCELLWVLRAVSCELWVVKSSPVSGWISHTLPSLREWGEGWNWIIQGLCVVSCERLLHSTTSVTIKYTLSSNRISRQHTSSSISAKDISL